MQCIGLLAMPPVARRHSAQARLDGPPRRDRAETAGQNLVNLFRIVGSPGYPLDENWLRDVGRQQYDFGIDPAAGRRHMAAIRASGDRRAELSWVRVATLVIHGEADPLQSVRAG